MDDLGLLSDWANGDAAAGQTLVKRHYRTLYRFFFGKVGEAAAADLTQSTFETLCEKRDEIRGDSTVRTYLFAVARWKLVGHFRQQRRQGERFDPLEDSVQDPAAERSFTSLLAGRRNESLVVQALRSLPLDDQIVLELKDLEALTARAMAEVLEVPPGTVAGRIARARERLRKAVAQLAESAEVRDGTLENLEGYMLEIRRVVDERFGDRVG